MVGAVVLALLIDAPIAAPSLKPCGTERWDVKILSDPKSRLIRFVPPVDITIAEVNGLPNGCAGHPRERDSGVELTLFEVEGRVSKKIRERDGDWHVVVSDGEGNTLVAESPSPGCAASSRYRTLIRLARAQVDRWTVGQVVRFRGVGFYDRFHGQTGMSRSCVEIHPILVVLPASPSRVRPAVRGRVENAGRTETPDAGRSSLPAPRRR